MPQLKHFKAEFFKALAHPVRISILDTLRKGEKTVAEISEQFGIELANASQRLAILRNKQIIEARKSGSNVYYSVSDPRIFKLLDVAKKSSTIIYTESEACSRKTRLTEGGDDRKDGRGAVLLLLGRGLIDWRIEDWRIERISGSNPPILNPPIHQSSSEQKENP